MFLICATSSGPSVLDPFVLSRGTSSTSILRGLSISSVFSPGPSYVQIPLVSYMGVACLRRVAVVVASGRPKPPLRELSPF